MRRAARFGEGWVPYFFGPAQVQGQRREDPGIRRSRGPRPGRFPWGFFPYISIYPTEQQAAEVAASQLGSQYLYGGEFINIVRRYCLLGTPEQCAERLSEYVEAGLATSFSASPVSPEDRERHLSEISEKLIPLFG